MSSTDVLQTVKGVSKAKLLTIHRVYEAYMAHLNGSPRSLLHTSAPPPLRRHPQFQMGPLIPFITGLDPDAEMNMIRSSLAESSESTAYMLQLFELDGEVNDLSYGLPLQLFVNTIINVILADAASAAEARVFTEALSLRRSRMAGAPNNGRLSAADFGLSDRANCVARISDTDRQIINRWAFSIATLTSDMLKHKIERNKLQHVTQNQRKQELQNYDSTTAIPPSRQKGAKRISAQSALKDMALQSKLKEWEAGNEALVAKSQSILLQLTRSKVSFDDLNTISDDLGPIQMAAVTQQSASNKAAASPKSKGHGNSGVFELTSTDFASPPNLQPPQPLTDALCRDISNINMALGTFTGESWRVIANNYCVPWSRLVTYLLDTEAKELQVSEDRIQYKRSNLSYAPFDLSERATARYKHAQQEEFGPLLSGDAKHESIAKSSKVGGSISDLAGVKGSATAEERALPGTTPLEYRHLHNICASACAFNQVGTSVVTGGEDGIAKLWCASTGAFADNIFNAGFAWIIALEFLSSTTTTHFGGDLLAVVTSNNQISIINTTHTSGRYPIVQKYVGSPSVETAVSKVPVLSTLTTRKYGMRPGESGARAPQDAGVYELSRKQYVSKRREEHRRLAETESTEGDTDKFLGTHGNIPARPIVSLANVSTFSCFPEASGICAFGTSDGAIGTIDLYGDVAANMSSPNSATSRFGGSGNGPKSIGREAGLSPIHYRPHAHSDVVTSLGYTIRYSTIISVSLDGQVGLLRLSSGVFQTLAQSIPTLGSLGAGSGPSGVFTSNSAVMAPRKPSDVAPQKPILGLCWCEHLQLFATFSSDRRIRLWNLMRADPAHVISPALPCRTILSATVTGLDHLVVMTIGAGRDETATGGSHAPANGASDLEERNLVIIDLKSNRLIKIISLNAEGISNEGVIPNDRDFVELFKMATNARSTGGGDIARAILHDSSRTGGGVVRYCAATNSIVCGLKALVEFTAHVKGPSSNHTNNAAQDGSASVARGGTTSVTAQSSPLTKAMHSPSTDEGGEAFSPTKTSVSFPVTLSVPVLHSASPIAVSYPADLDMEVAAPSDFTITTMTSPPSSPVGASKPAKIPNAAFKHHTALLYNRNNKMLYTVDKAGLFGFDTLTGELLIQSSAATEVPKLSHTFKAVAEAVSVNAAKVPNIDLEGKMLTPRGEPTNVPRLPNLNFSTSHSPNGSPSSPVSLIPAQPGFGQIPSSPRAGGKSMAKAGSAIAGTILELKSGRRHDASELERQNALKVCPMAVWSSSQHFAMLYTPTRQGELIGWCSVTATAKTFFPLPIEVLGATAQLSKGMPTDEKEITCVAQKGSTVAASVRNRVFVLRLDPATGFPLALTASGISATNRSDGYIRILTVPSASDATVTSVKIIRDDLLVCGMNDGMAVLMDFSVAAQEGKVEAEMAKCTFITTRSAAPSRALAGTNRRQSRNSVAATPFITSYDAPAVSTLPAPQATPADAVEFVEMLNTRQQSAILLVLGSGKVVVYSTRTYCVIYRFSAFPEKKSNSEAENNGTVDAVVTAICLTIAEDRLIVGDRDGRVAIVAVPAIAKGAAGWASETKVVTRFQAASYGASILSIQICHEIAVVEGFAELTLAISASDDSVGLFFLKAESGSTISITRVGNFSSLQECRWVLANPATWSDTTLLPILPSMLNDPTIDPNASAPSLFPGSAAASMAPKTPILHRNSAMSPSSLILPPSSGRVAADLVENVPIEAHPSTPKRRSPTRISPTRKSAHDKIKHRRRQCEDLVRGSGIEAPAGSTLIVSPREAPNTVLSPSAGGLAINDSVIQKHVGRKRIKEPAANAASTAEDNAYAVTVTTMGQSQIGGLLEASIGPVKRRESIASQQLGMSQRVSSRRLSVGKVSTHNIPSEGPEDIGDMGESWNQLTHYIDNLPKIEMPEATLSGTNQRSPRSELLQHTLRNNTKVNSKEYTASRATILDRAKATTNANPSMQAPSMLDGAPADLLSSTAIRLTMYNSALADPKHLKFGPENSTVESKANEIIATQMWNGSPNPTLEREVNDALRIKRSRSLAQSGSNVAAQMLEEANDPNVAKVPKPPRAVEYMRRVRIREENEKRTYREISQGQKVGEGK